MNWCRCCAGRRPVTAAPKRRRRGAPMGIETLALVLVAILFGCLALGLWVGFALIAVGLAAMLMASSAPVELVFATKVWGALNIWDLTALPMFIWMGEILFRSRLSSDMFSGLAPLT